MSEHDHLKKQSWFTEKAPAQREPKENLFGDAHVGSRTRTQDMVNPTVPVAESAFVKLARAKKAEQQEGAGDSAVEHIQRAATDSGSPLPSEVRGKFEASLGTDLSGVRVHTGAASATAAELVGAKAYTTGQDIHFGAAHYDPSSKEGQRLLGHEVAHTVQQGSARPAQPQAKLEVSEPADAHEQEADRAADAMVEGSPAAVSKDSVGGTIARSPNGMLATDGPNRPIIFEAPPEPAPRPFEQGLPPVAQDPIPAPFDMPIPIGRSVAPPQARDWSVTPPIVASPNEPLTGTPGYKPEYVDDFDTYKSAFNASWSEVQNGFNALVTLHHGFKSKENEIIPFLGADATVGVSANKLNATHSFEGSHLKPSLSKIDSKKVSPEIAKQVAAARDKVEVSELAIASQKEAIETANSRLRQVALDVENAMSDIDIAHLEGDIASLQLDKERVRRDLDQAKANIKAVVESAKAAFSIVGILSDPTKIFANTVGALNQSANAVGAATEAGYVYEANQKLDAIDTQIGALQSDKFRHLIKKASNTLAKNLEEMRIKGREVNKAIRDFQTAKKGQAAAYRELAGAMGSAGGASGMTKRDQNQLAAAVEAVPKIDTLVDQLEGMDRSLGIPSYSEESGIGAAMSSNLGAFTNALGILKGNKAYVAEQKAIWEGRKASVKAAIDQSLFVPGTEI